jgi:hypothetical protein
MPMTAHRHTLDGRSVRARLVSGPWPTWWLECSKGERRCRCLGVGGIFFRAQDPDARNAWYREHLGIGAGCAIKDTGPPDEWSWKVQGGPLVFAPFETGTDYWAADKQFKELEGGDAMAARTSEADDIVSWMRERWIRPPLICCGRWCRRSPSH